VLQNCSCQIFKNWHKQTTIAEDAMVSIEFDETSSRYRIRFRHGGMPFKRSLKTSEEKEPLSILGRVEETIRLMERGRLGLPPDAGPPTATWRIDSAI
jgi:hypothetical protein